MKELNIDRLFDNKLYADAEDFAREFSCSKGVGYKLIRSVKAVSDISNLSGKVTKADVLAWLFSPFKNIKKEDLHAT